MPDRAMFETLTAEQWRQFADGIAFYLRSYLMVVEGCAKLAGEQVDQSLPVASHINEIREAAQSCKEYVKMLGDQARYSRPA